MKSVFILSCITLMRAASSSLIFCEYSAKILLAKRTLLLHNEHRKFSSDRADEVKADEVTEKAERWWGAGCRKNLRNANGVL